MSRGTLDWRNESSGISEIVLCSSLSFFSLFLINFILPDNKDKRWIRVSGIGTWVCGGLWNVYVRICPCVYYNHGRCTEGRWIYDRSTVKRCTYLQHVGKKLWVLSLVEFMFYCDCSLAGLATMICLFRSKLQIILNLNVFCRCWIGQEKENRPASCWDKLNINTK